jgi:hypothetical protein
MAKKNKPKWLEATTPELITLLKETLGAPEPDLKKAIKIADEIAARQPVAGEGTPSVEEAIEALVAAMTNGITAVKTAYTEELAAMDAEDDDEDDDEEDAGEKKPDYSAMSTKELKAAAREAGHKVTKGMSKEELIALLVDSDDDEDDDDEDDDDGEDYEEMSQKDLKALCRERGLKVTKGLKKSDFIKLLEADDKN